VKSRQYCPSSERALKLTFIASLSVKSAPLGFLIGDAGLGTAFIDPTLGGGAAIFVVVLAAAVRETLFRAGVLPAFPALVVAPAELVLDKVPVPTVGEVVFAADTLPDREAAGVRCFPSTPLLVMMVALLCASTEEQQ
jgi:hypothetical protein